jgi:hypothetical protein
MADKKEEEKIIMAECYAAIEEINRLNSLSVVAQEKLKNLQVKLHTLRNDNTDTNK